MSQPKLEWQTVVNNETSGVPKVMRAQVPGGWLTTSVAGNTLTGVTFLPDEEHAWQIEVQQDLKIRVPANSRGGGVIDHGRLQDPPGRISTAEQPISTLPTHTGEIRDNQAMARPTRRQEEQIHVKEDQ